MIWWHRVGQKVACRYTEKPILDERWPVLGEVEVTDDDKISFRFLEIRNKPRMWRERFGESMFAASAFEPVFPQRVEELRRLCSPTPEQKRVVFEEMILERVGDAGFR